MKTSVEELNVPKVVFIADKGFYSKSNVANLSSSSLHYIIPLYRNNELIDFDPLQAANFKKTIKNYSATKIGLFGITAMKKKVNTSLPI